MSADMSQGTVIFPPWFDDLVKLLGLGGAVGGAYVVGLVWFGFSPKTTDVGYMPEQPVPYSHKIHVGELGLDCRYCHTGVEVTASAGVPPTETCMNCHSRVHANDDARVAKRLTPLWESFEVGTPVEWVRVHDISDFAYFDHSAHVTRGVSCVSCHGRVDKMAEVYQAETLSMGFCLECHRNPENHLRPVDKVTDLAWKAPGDPKTPEENQRAVGLQRMRELGLHDAEGNPTTRMKTLESCSTCHR